MEDYKSGDQTWQIERRDGFDKLIGLPRAQKGGGYQVKIAALFVASALKRQNVRYNLSVEDKSAGKFDDIVFKLFEEERRIRCCVQAKHKEVGSKILFQNLLFSEKGDFSLIKYFQSFLNIRENQDSKGADVDKFIIYTPAMLHFATNHSDDITWKMTYMNHVLIFKRVTDDYGFLDKSKGSLFQLQPNDYIRNHLKAAVKAEVAADAEVDYFLGNLWFAVGQPTETEIDNLLEEKLKEANTGIEPRKLKDNLCTGLDKWFKEDKTKAIYFTEIDVAKIILKMFSDTSKDKLALANVTFSDYDDLDKLFENSESAFHTVPCSLKLCCTKYLTYPKGSKELFLLQLQDFMKVKNIFLSSLPLNGPTIIVVVVEEGDNVVEEKKALESLVRRMQTPSVSHVSKLIVVQRNESMQEIMEENNVVPWEDGTYTFASLSSETQHLLMQTRVTFQGNSITFKEICGENNFPALRSHHIEMLLSGPEVVIGKYVPKTETTVNSYVSRTIYLGGFLREEYLFSLSDDEYVVITSKEDDYQALFNRYKQRDNIFPVNSEKTFETFNKLRLSNPRKNIHVLESKKKGNSRHLQWLGSHGSLFTLRSYVEKSKKFYKKETDQSPIVVIAAEPGMGKTTQLSHIAEEVKKQHRDWWVVNLTLKDLASRLLNMNMDGSITHFSKYLSEILLEGETTLSKILFQHSFEETGKFILLLDGYDEIESREERTKVLLVLQKLKDHSRGQVIITTRLHFKEELEEATSTFAYRLEPLNETEQEKLLAEVWIKNLDVSSDDEKLERVYVYAREVVKHFCKKANKRIGSLIGIPLQVTLLAEVCEERCKLFCNKQEADNASVQFPFTKLFSLYSKFENMKCDKFIKCDANHSSLFRMNLIHMVSEEHRSVCTEKALDELLTDNSLRCDCCLSMLRKSRFLDEQDILKIGILHKSDKGNISFVHRSFAEYFFAIHLAQIMTNGRPCKKLKKLLKSKFYEEGYQVIRLFADNALAKSRIHIAALTNDVHALGEELENGADINERDALGRTPCHLAGAHECEEAFELLVSRGCDLQAKENVAHFTPCKLAVELSSMKDFNFWSLPCLYKNGRLKEYNEILRDKNLNASGHLSTFLPRAVYNGDVDTIRFILKSAERHDIKFWVVFPRNWKETTSMSQSQVACLQLILEFIFRRREFLMLREILYMGYQEHIKAVFSAMVDFMHKRKDSLKEIVLLAIFSQYDDLMAIAFDKISEITKDFPSYILQPLESHETLVHLAVRYDLDKAVRCLFSRLQEEGSDILSVLFPENVQEESLIHLAAYKLNCGLLRFFIDFIRENKGNVLFYLCQQNSVGRTTLHCAVVCLHSESIPLIVGEMKSEQTPIFDFSLLNSAEYNDKGTFFNFLFEKIMAHGNNLLAFSMQKDSFEHSFLYYLRQLHDHEPGQCHGTSKIDGICAFEWVKKELEEEIQKVFQATSTTHEVNDFMEYLFLKNNPEKKSTFFIAL